MIITLCGSTRFKDEYELVAKDLALQGHTVLSVNLFAHADNIELTQEQKIRLDNAHKQKISISDAIYVINKGQYIGESTYGEIDWAERLGKKIFFFEDIEASSSSKEKIDGTEEDVNI
jgi:hypothetical protein